MEKGPLGSEYVSHRCKRLVSVFIPQEISYYIISLGCSKNLVDSEWINGIMDGAGFCAAESSGDADIIIINTCGFIEDAKRESIDVLFDAIDLAAERKTAGKDKQNSFETRVVAAGCLVERYFNEIRDDIPELDFLYGVIDEKFVYSMCEAFAISCTAGDVSARKPLIPGLPYSYIKISDGCSNNCSYCAIPLIRGPVRSFPLEDIVRDVHRAVNNGSCEIIIIAQDIMAYHRDGKTLVDVIHAVTDIQGVQWVRLLYCHPDHLSDDLIAVIGENKKVVRYLDLPFQHVNSRILGDMNRKGNYQSYIKLVKKIREAVPGIHLRSTFMVGFPGETDAEFQELMSFIREAKLERVGCFMYSPEEDTAAANFDDTVPLDIKTKRYDKLMAAQKQISAEVMSSMVGTTVQAIVEEQLDETTWICRTEFDAPEVDGIFYLTAQNVSVNKIVNVKVTDAIDYDLVGVMA